MIFIKKNKVTNDIEYFENIQNVVMFHAIGKAISSGIGIDKIENYIGISYLEDIIRGNEKISFAEINILMNKYNIHISEINNCSIDKYKIFNPVITKVIYIEHIFLCLIEQIIHINQIIKYIKCNFLKIEYGIEIDYIAIGYVECDRLDKLFKTTYDTLIKLISILNNLNIREYSLNSELKSYIDFNSLPVADTPDLCDKFYETIINIDNYITNR